MKVVIIGNGIAGVSCARHLRKLSPSVEVTIVSGETEFHYSRPALMYLFMGHMRWPDLKPYEDWFWEKNRITLRKAWVESVDFAERRLTLDDGQTLGYDKLLLATGSSTTYYDWPGQAYDGVHGLVTIGDVEAMERHAKRGIERGVVVGGGLIGIEMAECLHTRGIPVSLLVREDSYWSKVLPPEESAMVTRHIQSKHGVDLRLNSEIKEILSSNRETVTAVALADGSKVECQFVGIATGVKPNVDFLRHGELEIDKGIVVDDQLRTSVEHVFAAGDCSQLRTPKPNRKSIEAIWYTGRMQGETAAHNILGQAQAYDPGLYFNSAKFFDIEYSVYGETPAVLPEGHKWYYYEASGGEKSVRLYWNAATGAVTGFHLMGTRYRQDVCFAWIAERRHIEEVVADLGMADFDPELYEETSPHVVAGFNAQEGTFVKLATRRGLPAVQRFLARFRKTRGTTTQPQ